MKFKIELFDASGERLTVGNTSVFDPRDRTLAAVKDYMAGDFCDWIMRGACYPGAEARRFRAGVKKAASFRATVIAGERNDQ